MKNNNRMHKIEKFNIDSFWEVREFHLNECAIGQAERNLFIILPPDAISNSDKFLNYPTNEIRDFEEISQKIKTVRVKFGITQKQMATVLNMAQPSYSDIEKEGNMPSVKTISAIAAFFNISLSYFYGLTNEFFLLADRQTFYKVNGYCLLDFVTPEKIKEVMTENNSKYHFEEHSEKYD